ncbi:alpha/beta fold hydrolase [Bdellovibrio sp. HCB2-146]|uniref:alpha/beta fold hydrolase n=1 Tax=Bdellovibrio sp. HCB2-146 TaxID=3394362 RepID=UPI0039BD916A
MKCLRAIVLFLFLTNLAEAASLAVDAKTQFLEKDGRKIAYRSIGQGPPLILGLRFRGIMDSWDPAFLDALAKDFRVITFDWSGIGRSTGKRATTMKEMVKDFTDLAEGLKLKNPVIGGWSMGGMVAQETLAAHPGLFTHGILIGTTPACATCGVPTKEFLAAAGKTVNDLKDEEILFFYPPSKESMKAAQASHERIAQRTKDTSVMMPPEFFMDQQKAVAGYRENKTGVMDMHMKGKTPILVIAGDHDNACKPEDWYQFSGKMANTHLVVYPQTGHAPQHQYPELSAKYIRDFVQTTSSKADSNPLKISGN